jgi:DUF1680 family protein/cyclophilin family peptidyl-prolyl cis-trans isomerase
MTSTARYWLTAAILGLMAATVYADALWLENPKLKVQDKVQPKVWAFDLKDVRLLDGPFKHAMDLNGAYILSLDVDRLLHTFRLNAGIPSAAQPLGGWEEPGCELRGHFVGHYLSACALMYASTGDPRYKQKGDAVVAGLAQCQAKLGTGYLSAYPESFFDRVEALQPVWAPYYTLHKIFAGLEDMVEYCDNSQALEVCKKFGDWVISRNSRLTDQQMQAMLGAEHGGMNETLANLYALTGEEKYLKIAMRFNHQAVLGPASQKEDKLTGLHANTQFPKFIGVAREYELTGDPSLYTAATFFWGTVVNERSYVTGGNSDGEMFTPKERLSEALGPNTTETCNTYNMLKLTRHLLCLYPETAYGDYYERGLYNHILASQNPEDGMTCYYVPLRSGMTRGGAGNGYCTPLNSFWCCTGTGVENHAKYGDSIYFHSNDTLYVNLFIASELDWRAMGLKVRQETRYPDEESTKLTFTCDKPADLSLRIRSPYWAKKGVQVTINGQPSTVQSVALPRTWKTGDVVEVKMPFTLRTEAFKDNPNRLAFLNGPIVLCGQIDPAKAPPAIVAEPNQMMSNIRAVEGKSNTFTLASEVVRVPGENAGVKVTLEPFYKMHGNRPYAVYWDRFTADQWQAKEAEYKAELARQKEIEARTVDYVLPGNPQNERDHNLQGERTNTGDFSQRKFRDSQPNGRFSWDLKVLPDLVQDLSVTYWGLDEGRHFDVFVGDTKLASERLANQGPKFYDKTYSLSPSLLKGKDKITVRFQAPADSLAGGVFGIRVMKAVAHVLPQGQGQGGDSATAPHVQIVTELGTIEAELDARRAPVTVKNFLRYVDAGYFDDGSFFRTVTMANQPTDKVKIQVIQAEANSAKQASLFPPIPLERTGDTGIHHLDGTLSMARDKPDTAQESFSICIGDQPDLDFGGKRNPDGQGFAAFGRVVSGMDVARQIQSRPADGQKLSPRVRILRIVRGR